MRLSQDAKLWVVFSALILAACSQRDPAQKLINDIDAAVSAASPDAAKYVPDDLIDVQKKAAELKASFDKKDYKAVVNAAPPVLAAAQSLATSSAVKKEQETKKRQLQWAALAAEVPGDINVIQSRIDFLGKPRNRKLASGVDLDAARGSLGDATLLWSNAQQAYTASRFEEAMADGNGAKGKLQALAASMKLDFSQPAAVQDTSPGQ
jgi:hypothetical protein